MQKINLQMIIKLLLAKLRWLVLFAVIGGVLLGCFAKFCMQEKYTSSVSMYVSNIADAAQQEAMATYSNLTSSEWLVLTYTDVLKYSASLEKVLPLLSRNITVQQLSKMVTVVGIEDTAMMRIKVTADDPVFAAEVCNVLADMAPEILQNVESGTVRVIGEARRGVKTSPNVPKMAVLGLLAGFVLTALFVVLRYLLDNTVKTEADLKARLQVPVLGTIPEFEQSLKGGSKDAKKQR